ncbi:MAG: DUF2085 domain-containing protein [Candidatus Izimaplasma sp.]|nr:DUF2085 domain-containing protein [Candidatus Izimaplasma bacterium]
MKIGRNIGCHQMSCRSFFYKNYQFPVCSRCTGILLGEFILAPVILLIGFNNIYLNLSFLLLMAIDGLLQYFKILQSNNIRRFFTGLGAGYAITSLLVYGVIYIFSLI